MEGETVRFPKTDPAGDERRGGAPPPSRGSAGLRTQIPGGMATVSELASATGGTGPGNFIGRDAK